MILIMKKIRSVSALLFCLLAASIACAQSPPRPDIVLRGTITGKQNHTYEMVPFDVPSGIVAFTVTFHYTGHDQRTTIDMGLFDPQRFRGWSGGNKSTFTVSESNATPSYLPGPILPGTWKLILGVSNIRPGATSQYEADIYFARQDGEESFTDQPLRNGPAWYRGDLHMHTAHSDGSCLSQSGRKVPCPVFLTAQAASERGLDFIAVTDHNTDSHEDALRELQPYFDQLLFVPGREITTFWGHANLFGPTQFFDFRVGDTTTTRTLFERAEKLHAILSINHPNAPTGEECMGCGWTPQQQFDPRLVHVMEAVNGGDEDGPHASISFWEKYLDQGLRVTAIGGSDNHNAQIPAGKINAIGRPETVVYADNLSVPSLLDAIRKGHVFVDLSASRDRILDVSAMDNQQMAKMGDALAAPANSTIAISAHLVACQGLLLRFLLDGQPVHALQTNIQQTEQVLALTLKADGKKHWLRPDVVTPEGRLVLLGNPIYLNYTESRE